VPRGGQSFLGKSVIYAKVEHRNSFARFGNTLIEFGLVTLWRPEGCNLLFCFTLSIPVLPGLQVVLDETPRAKWCDEPGSSQPIPTSTPMELTYCRLSGSERRFRRFGDTLGECLSILRVHRSMSNLPIPAEKPTREGVAVKGSWAAGNWSASRPWRSWCSRHTRIPSG
jgi:hypothetical protein